MRNTTNKVCIYYKCKRVTLCPECCNKGVLDDLKHMLYKTCHDVMKSVSITDNNHSFFYKNDSFSLKMRYQTANIKKCSGNEKKLQKEQILRGKVKSDGYVSKSSALGWVSIT